MTITKTEITYEAGGTTMRSTLYSDNSLARERPGILVLPDARGLDDVAHASAERLAEQGYAALACDVYGDALFIEKADEAVPYASKLIQNLDHLATVIEKSIEVMNERQEVESGHIGAFGYCFGGNVAVEAARAGLPLAAIVAFHGGVVPPSPERTRKIAGKVLICTGSNDPMIPVASRNAFEEDMRAANVDWRMHLYGRAYHSFTNPAAHELAKDALRYDKGADQRSWMEASALLTEVFG